MSLSDFKKKRTHVTALAVFYTERSGCVCQNVFHLKMALTGGPCSSEGLPSFKSKGCNHQVINITCKNKRTHCTGYEKQQITRLKSVYITWSLVTLHLIYPLQPYLIESALKTVHWKRILSILTVGV